MVTLRLRAIVVLSALAIGALWAPAARAQEQVPPVAPQASFDMNPVVATVGETVTFTDRSVDVDGMIVRREWDINGDGVISDPDGAPQVSRSYSEPGTYTILLRVTDNDGLTAQTTRELVVVGDGAPAPSNRDPSASLAFAPGEPTTGDAVSFTSTSRDPDGSIVSQAWDLDGDGRFTDASGSSAQWTYTTPGARTVGVRVTDDRGATATGFESITVLPTAGSDAGPVATAAPGSSPPVASSSRARLLAPFPVVRIRGQIFTNTVRIALLSVRAPSGTTVQVRCTGRGCPYRAAVARTRSGGKAVRFKALERRLRAGTVLRLFVTKRGQIGKYTRFTIRRGSPPARTDRCLLFGSVRPIRCPSQ